MLLLVSLSYSYQANSSNSLIKLKEICGNDRPCLLLEGMNRAYENILESHISDTTVTKEEIFMKTIDGNKAFSNVAFSFLS